MHIDPDVGLNLICNRFREDLLRNGNQMQRYCDSACARACICLVGGRAISLGLVDSIDITNDEPSPP